MNVTNKNPDGFVLIGGASSRMGRHKAQMTIGGRMLFERAVVALSAVCPTRVTLVGNFGSDFDYDLPVISDICVDLTDHLRAPIVGLFTALTYAKTSWIAVLACDLPFVTEDLMIKLGGFCSDEFDAVVPVQQDNRPQPLCAFYRRERCLPVAEKMLKTGDLKLQRFLSFVSTRYIKFDEIAGLDGSAHFFLNVNKPEDYDSALKIA